MNKIAVTLKEAVEMTGIGRSTFYKLFKSGELQRRKVGKRVLIAVADLESLIQSLPAA